MSKEKMLADVQGLRFCGLYSMFNVGSSMLEVHLFTATHGNLDTEINYPAPSSGVSTVMPE